ncbi:MAG TPA: FHA domain-containing protein [Thermoleophilaceae bacterium]
MELCPSTPLPGSSPLERSVGWVSRWMERIERAWWEPRIPLLALPADARVVLLGRSPECDCVLSDETVSRQHAALRQEGGSWFLRDLRSTNGTRVNGTRVLDEVEVRPGDRVAFGALAYRLGSPRGYVALRRRSSSDATSAGADSAPSS